MSLIKASLHLSSTFVNSIEVLMGCHNKLVKPRLAPNQSLTGRLMKRIFSQRTIYVRPDSIILQIDREVSVDTCSRNWEELVYV